MSCDLRWAIRVFALAAAPAIGSGPVAGQFSAGVDLVEVYATVLDEDGAPLTDLDEADFEVRENGERRELAVFAAGDFPLAVGLAIDRSWSMAGRPLAMARSAALTFLGRLAPSDRSMIIVIGGDTTVLAPLGTGRAPQLEAVAGLSAWGTTQLYDAIVEGLTLLEPAGGRRALVLLSDGDERYSTATAADVTEHVRRGGVLVYPVAVGERRPAIFAELAALSGGRSFHVTDPRRLTDVLQRVALELRHQYLLGYVPAAPGGTPGPEWRSIQVEVRRPGARVRARPGYVYRPRSSRRSRQARATSNVPSRRRLSPA